jgi:hypothetical protein
MIPGDKGPWIFQLIIHFSLWASGATLAVSTRQDLPAQSGFHYSRTG